MTPIQHPPETWFTSFQRAEPLPDDIRHFARAMTSETIQAIVDALAMEESQQEIAESCGVTVYIVDVIRRHMGQWVIRSKAKRPGKTYSNGGGGKNRPIAPDGSVVVPAHKCDQTSPPHYTVFEPCLICQARLGWQKRDLVVASGKNPS